MGNLFRRSAILFTKPSFLEGFSRVVDIGSTINEYRIGRIPAEADEVALRSDWSAVGDSICSAFINYGDEHEKQECSST